MNNEKMHIESNTVQETLVIPLWGRKYCSEIYPEIYRDPIAEKIMEKLDYDFSVLDTKKKSTLFRFGYLEAAARYMDLGIEVRNYLKEPPAAAVVNLGCGLDCTAENNAEPSCKIYNIDRPDVIGVRNRLISPTGNVTNIGADLNDTTWFDEVKKLFTAMSERFRGGRLVFDTANKSAVKMMLKTWVKTAGITDISKYFYIDDLDTGLRSWLPGAEISAKGYMLGYSDLKTPSVSGFFRFLSKVGDGMMKMRIVQITFHKTKGIREAKLMYQGGFQTAEIQAK